MSENEAAGEPLPPIPSPAPAPAPAAIATAPASASSVGLGEWRPLPNAAGTTAMYGGSALGLLLGAGVAAFIAFPLLVKADFLDLSWWQGLLASFVLWLLFGAGGALVSYRRWKSTTWMLDDTGLNLRRGFWWRKEVLVPRSRVQHLDIERGPIERHYLLASLVVHTAGTRHHALRIPGLADADAIALRDALVPESSRHDDVL